jgi:PadR family transcriptional regulator, regulatory protein PadR
LPAEQKVAVRPRTWLTPIALVILHKESSYGYQLMERLATDFEFEQINAGTLYRTLRQMEKEGLCSSQWDVRAKESGPPRRMYAITEVGEAYLEAWAEACAKYHRLMDQFAQVYGRRPPRSEERG